MLNGEGANSQGGQQKGGKPKRGCWFWNRVLRQLCTLVLRLKKISCRTCLTFLFIYFFFSDKNISITWWLNSFVMPSYDSESRRRYLLRLLLMCLVVDVSRGRSWKLYCLGWGRGGKGLSVGSRIIYIHISIP